MAYLHPTAVARHYGAQGAAVADAGALTSAAITGGDAPTEGEHNQVQADVAALRTKLNALLAQLRAAGVIASS